VETITSVRNRRVVDAVALGNRTERRRRGRHLAEGPRVVAEALAAGSVEELFATEAALATLDVPEDVAVRLVADHVMERLSDARTPQGVVGVVRTELAPLDAVVGHGLLVVLHEVADPGNAGTIVRTADAVGAVGVVLTPDSVDAHAPKTVRAAAGSTYHLPIVEGVALSEVAAACREAGQPLLGLDTHGRRSVFDLETATPPIAIVLGNEAHGLPGAVAEVLDDTVAIPVWGRAESLNVAAAAAVALYAAGRGVHEPPRT
jgi:RNA methyltransferase, TrmH family